MNISDFNKVAELMKMRRKVQEALVQANEYEVDESDAGCIADNQSGGFYGYFSTHYDGSGNKLDLAGCYVESAAIEAITEVLEVKLESIEAELVNLGVDLTQ